VAPLVSRWIERLLSNHDPALTVAQYLALRAIDGDGATTAELAEGTGVSGPAVSQLVTSLVQAGFVERRESADDRRRQVLCLTSEGKTALESAQQVLREQLGTLLSDLPKPEADALSNALPRVEAVLAGRAPPRRPHPPPPPHHHRHKRP
jgi:DNA-binding MarR family transcriptional regulator